MRQGGAVFGCIGLDHLTLLHETETPAEITPAWVWDESYLMQHAPTVGMRNIVARSRSPVMKRLPLLHRAVAFSISEIFTRPFTAAMRTCRMQYKLLF
jgi:hypothetical protein